MAELKEKFVAAAKQAELNAVLMYRELAKYAKDNKVKEMFLEAAKDEGRHASILSKYTDAKLTAKDTQGKVLAAAYRILPGKLIYIDISKGEYAGGDSYKPYAKENSDFEEMMNDEYRHGDIFKKLAEETKLFNFGKSFNIQAYMTRGVTRVLFDSLRATSKNPVEGAFMKGFAKAARAASKKRAAAEKQGEHIPPFLIASIASTCNLHCAGCYSRANNACCDSEQDNQLTDTDWDKIFTEADELGISFILLAGGEPMMRYDVIKKAAEHKNILFPVFTNGTFLHEKYLDVLDKHRNILPIISIEGDEKLTDDRRGDGVYKKVLIAMQNIKKRGMIFGASVTVTKENMAEVYSDKFVKELNDLGCKAIIYVEYVPVTEESKGLAPTEEDHKYMKKAVRRLRITNRKTVFIAFPGDEKNSGGCVAAGRGFFHINAHGGAEPCPFSPYSDINVKDTSIREALKSPLFYALNTEGLLKDDHIGGCTLYMNRERVEEIIAQGV